MKDQTKTKTQLIEELQTLRQSTADLRQRVVELETSAIGSWQNGDRFSSSEERFRQFIFSFGDHIYVTEVTDTGRRVNLYLSPNVEKLTGYSEAQLMADWSFWPSRIIHPDDRAAAAVQAAQLSRGQHSEVEYRLIRADDRIIWVRDSARVDLVGTSKIVYGVVTDITIRKHREEALAKLLELSRALVTHHSPTEVLDQAIMAATEIAPAADRGSLQLLDEDGETLRTVAISSPDETLGQTIIFRPGVGIAGHALAGNQTINVSDVLADPRFMPSDLPLRFRSLLVAPLVVKGRLLGTLSLSSQKTGAFSEADKVLVQLIADQVAAALENARLLASHLQTEKLRKAHQFLQATIDALASHIAILDENGRIIAVNAPWRHYADANGYAEPNYGVGANYLDICDSAAGPNAEHALLVADGIRQVIKDQQRQFYLEYPAHTPLEPQWFGVRVTRFQDEGAIWIVVAHVDVTERRVAEEALRASEEQYRDLTNHLPVGLYRDTPQGKLGYANPTLAAILGYETANDILQTSIRDIFDDPSERNKQLEACQISGEIVVNEMKVHTADGAHIWVRDIARVFLNEAGKITYIDGIIQDITEYKEAEQTLQASESRFRSLIQNSSDIITLLAAGGTVQYISPPVKRILGHQPEAVIGQNIFAYIHPDDLPRVQTRFNEIVQQPGLGNILTEFRIRGTNGTWRWLEAVSNNLLDDPNVCGVVINARDISQRKQVEEQLRLLEVQFLQAQKMDAIGRLAGGVAHDFNNVLTIIKGYADLLLLRLGKRSLLRTYAEEIKKASNQAAVVTRQLLIFSRQEMAQPEVIDLNAVVVDIEKMLARLIGEDIDLVTFLDPGLGLIKANPGHIEQVIMNLVINARDAMPQGGGLTIQTANVTVDETGPYQPMPIQPGKYVQLTVSDTGMGMTEETLNHIFEPFFTTKEPDKGTGLGLSTVYAIVTQSKGGIQVFSEPEQGTTFSIYLPYLTDGKEPISKKQKKERLAPKPGGQSETILLVEDQTKLRELAKLVLQKQGYRVLEARHGDEALQICLQIQEPIHLILTDVVMPGGISGRELVERVKPLMPETRVIYMSGYTDDVIVHHGVLHSTINFLQKPFAPNILLTKVREVLDAS